MSVDTHPHCGASQESSLRGLEFSLDCSTVVSQLSINANSMTRFSLQNQNPSLALFMSNLFKETPKQQG